MIKVKKCIGMHGEIVLPKERRFSHLHSFNLAMPANQVWRLIDAPNSLCAQVLRSKYYPSNEVLQAKLYPSHDILLQGYEPSNVVAYGVLVMVIR
jgi:hypothetical protein